MAEEKPTLGKAIDDTIRALEPLDTAARSTALAAVCAHLGIDLGPSAGPARQDAPDAAPASPADSSYKPPKTVDIRGLKDEKQPSNSQQMACLVAYYLANCAPEAERRDSVSPADLDKYFKQANYPLPSRLHQVLNDAKRAGYLESVGRGQYKLNAVGHNLVAHKLPPEQSG